MGFTQRLVVGDFFSASPVSLFFLWSLSINWITVGSEEARQNASLRPPPKLDMQFSSIQLSRKCSFPSCNQRNQINLPRFSPISEVGFIEYRLKDWLINEWSFFASVGLIQSTSLLGWRRTGFSLMELILLYIFTHWFSFSTQPPSPTAFPSPFRCRLFGHAAFTALLGTIRLSDY
jgi:hypothetical protein